MLSTVAKAAQVLSLFSPESPEWGVRDAARVLRIPKSSAHELMDTLAEHNLLRRTGSARYRLGWKLFELSQTLLETTEFRTEARRAMEDLVVTWRETTHLAVLDGAQVVYLEKLQPIPAVKILISRVGSRLPAHCSAVGKVLLAHCPQEVVVGTLEQTGMQAFTANTITDADELARELDRVREQGYAYDNEEVTAGLCCVAAPISDPEGDVIAAVSIAAPAFRFQEKRECYTAAILRTARHVSDHASGKLREYPYYSERTRTYG